MIDIVGGEFTATPIAASALLGEARKNVLRRVGTLRLLFERSVSMLFRSFEFRVRLEIKRVVFQFALSVFGVIRFTIDRSFGFVLVVATFLYNSKFLSASPATFFYFGFMRDVAFSFACIDSVAVLLPMRRCLIAMTSETQVAESVATPSVLFHEIEWDRFLADTANLESKQRQLHSILVNAISYEECSQGGTSAAFLLRRARLQLGIIAGKA